MIITLKKDCIKSPQHMRSEPTEKSPYSTKDIKKGKHKQIFGKAYQPDKNDPGKLKISFFLWFYSGYYILELDDDYQFAVVGSSSEKYLWILSRTKTLPQETYSNLLQRLQQRGYDTEKPIPVEQ